MWLMPMYYTLGSVLFATVFPRIEYEFGTGYALTVGGYIIAPSVTSAQAALSAIASGMMALTAIVFSIAYITIQFSSMAYSPRLALWFARDPILFHSFGMFIATFLYALVTLAWVDRGGSGAVPVFSIIIVVILLVVSMILFARLVRGLHDLVVTNTLRTVGDRGREVIRDMFETPGLQWKLGSGPPLSGPGPVTQSLRYKGDPKAIARFDVATLVALAEQAGGIIVMESAVGDTIVNDAVLLEVHAGKAEIPEAALLSAIHLAPERTFEQDPKYPIRLLVDIAIKALSAAINDPTTAVQALDQIEDLLHRLARKNLDAGYGWDSYGQLRLIFPMPGWEDYLRLSFDEIRQYGASSVQVMRRMRAALAAIEQSLIDEDRLAAVRRYIQQIDARISRSDLDAQDRAVASQGDRQGLGMSRKTAEAKPAASSAKPPLQVAGSS